MKTQKMKLLKKMEKWTKTKAEWTSRSGFGLLAHLAMRDPTLSDDYFETYWAITRAVKMRFDEEGISIPFPQTDVHLYKT